MPTATKEFILNYAMNRWQLNFKRNVGPTSDSIRQCKPASLEQWQNYYFTNIRSEDHLRHLGNVLFENISNELPQEDRFHPALVSSITRQDCIDYIRLVVINRTYDGYMKERGK